MAYDALRETTPSRSSKEYVKILKLAAEAGEVQVDEALRELLEKAEAGITEESIGGEPAKIDTIPAAQMGGGGPVGLAWFDPLWPETGVRQWATARTHGRRRMGIPRA